MSRLHSQFPSSNLSILHTHRFPQFCPTNRNLPVLVCLLFSLLQQTALFPTEDWVYQPFPPMTAHLVLNPKLTSITRSHLLLLVAAGLLLQVHLWVSWQIFHPFSPASVILVEMSVKGFAHVAAIFTWATPLVQAKDSLTPILSSLLLVLICSF